VSHDLSAIDFNLLLATYGRLAVVFVGVENLGMPFPTASQEAPDRHETASDSAAGSDPSLSGPQEFPGQRSWLYRFLFGP
jgi:hypothetical protein